MKPILLLCFFLAGSMGSYYAPPLVRLSPPPFSPPAPPPSSYAAPPYSPPIRFGPRPYSPPVRVAPPEEPIALPYAAPVRIAPAPYSAPIRLAAPPPFSPPAPAYAAPLASPYESYGSSASRQQHIPITKFSHEIQPGGHQLSFETGHGISHSETLGLRVNPAAVGTPEDANHGKALLTKSGQVSYTSPEGKRISLQYTADENGFHPTGDHLPTSPPIPEAILESIRVNKAAEAARAAGGGGARSGSGYGYGSSPY